MASDNGALAVIVLLRVWQFGSAMVIFLAALKGVSQDLYEAASIDGAGKWTQFFKITVPLITPVIFYNLITQLCQAFQEFNGPFFCLWQYRDGYRFVSSNPETQLRRPLEILSLHTAQLSYPAIPAVRLLLFDLML